MKKISTGDLVEINGKSGNFYYCQYTHYHEVFGCLLAIFKYDRIISEPLDLDALVMSEVCTHVFYPLKRSIKQGIFRIVGNRPVRPSLTKFPVFRAGFAQKSGEDAENWWLWNGEDEWYVGKLENIERYPVRRIVNDAYLVDLAEKYCAL